MAAAAAGLAVWALFATPASALPARADDTPVARIADEGDSAVTRVDPVGNVVASDPNHAGVTGGGVASREGERLHARAARKPRCLWRRRACYPPANLWYRIKVNFSGVLTRPRSPMGNCFPCSVRRTELNWSIVSDHAVRLRLMCDEEADDAGPFVLKRMINGRRRPIGGCARRARGVRTSLRFGARAGGALTRWTNTFTADPVDGPGERCDGYTVNASASPQALSGAIRTSGGSAAGIAIDVTPVGRVLPPSGPPPTHSCTNKITGETTTRHGDTGLGGACCHIFGSTAWYQRDQLGWRPITERLRFSPKAANFGRRYTAVLHAEQDAITDSPITPAPPAGAPILLEEQLYRYGIHLEPCPNRGLDVKRC